MEIRATTPIKESLPWCQPESGYCNHSLSARITERCIKTAATNYKSLFYYLLLQNDEIMTTKSWQVAGLRRNYASGPQTRRFTEPAGLLSLSRSHLHIYTCTHRFCEGCPLSLSAVKQTLKFSQEAIGLAQLGGHLETAPPEQWGQWGQIQENTENAHTVPPRHCLSLPPRLGKQKGEKC